MNEIQVEETKLQYAFWNAAIWLLLEIEDLEGGKKRAQLASDSSENPRIEYVAFDQIHVLSNDEKLLLVPPSELSDDELVQALEAAQAVRMIQSDRPVAKAKREKKSKKKSVLEMDEEAVSLLGLDLL